MGKLGWLAGEWHASVGMESASLGNASHPSIFLTKETSP